jgi:hypothetical protein
MDLGRTRPPSPLCWLLSLSTQGVLKLLRIDNAAQRAVTEEEIVASLAEGRGRRGDRAPRTPDGAQRVPPGRSAADLHHGAARRHPLARCVGQRGAWPPLAQALVATGIRGTRCAGADSTMWSA